MFSQYLLLVNYISYLWRIADAEENLGESEVREAHLAKSLYFIRVGEKVYPLFFFTFFRIVLMCSSMLVLPDFSKFQEKALEQLKVTEGKTVAVGQKMDLVFYTLQIGFFYMDFDLISKSIDKAKK